MKMLTSIILIQIMVAGAIATPSRKVITKPVPKEFHIFHADNGKTVRGRVLAYIPNSDTVMIAKENGKRFKVGLSQFSEADQAYVHDWHLVQEFFTRTRFHLSAKMIKRVGVEQNPWHLLNEDCTQVWKPIKSIAYQIKLENRSWYDLKGLTVDYCIYHGEEKLNDRGQVMSQGIITGTKYIGAMARGKKVWIKTEAVDVPKEGKFEYYKEDKRSKPKLLGIWVRVYLPLPDGNKAMREFSLPDSLIKQRTWGATPE